MDQYAVFGHPIAQSKSPQIHIAFAEETSQELGYRAILSAKDGFSEALNEFFSDPNAKGCNVTMPFKQEAAEWVDDLSPAAQSAGSVNTIIRQADGRFLGDTTDGYGLVTDLTNHGVKIEDQSILLIGAGGAARGVVAAILSCNPKQLVITNRSADKAQTLVELANDERVNCASFKDLDRDSLSEKFDIIINSTSTSLSDHLPPIHQNIIKSASCVYDMVYLKEPTVFLQQANELGVPCTLDGLGMLVGQAAQSFFLWRGIQPKGSGLLEKLRSEL
jgi:shikimate dehydrogenase